MEAPMPNLLDGILGAEDMVEADDDGSSSSESDGSGAEDMEDAEADDNSSDDSSDDSDDDSESDGGSESDGSGGGNAFELSCLGCSALVTRRGALVRLIADTTSMYSTDLVTTGMEDRGRVHTHQSCGCQCRSIFCAQCHRMLGYHVLEPCQDCREGGNNGHYYMFVPGNVRGRLRALPSRAPDWTTRWMESDELGAFEPRAFRRSSSDAVFLSPEPEVQECTCAVCLDILEDPLTLPCGHTFCRICASRAVDLQRCWCARPPEHRSILYTLPSCLCACPSTRRSRTRRVALRLLQPA
jgi:hypothetical protein